jgi:uncharacterized protein DUF5818
MKIASLATALLFVSAVAMAGTAQEQEKTTHKKVRTIAGCLEKSDDAGEYKLTTAAGATWEIKSDAVNLGDHVGHTVRVTGTVRAAALHGMKEDTKEKAAEHGVNKDETEHGHMEVTAVKMVSGSCKK